MGMRRTGLHLQSPVQFAGMGLRWASASYWALICVQMDLRLLRFTNVNYWASSSFLLYGKMKIHMPVPVLELEKSKYVQFFFKIVSHTFRIK
jgi:hypothetical protein